jgi:hypothetical protein
MALVAVLTGDLMFGSRLHAMLEAAGHTAALADDGRLVELMSADGSERPALLLVDLTDAAEPREALIADLDRRGCLEGVRTAAFYSHVDLAAREAAERAGIELVVPRSRIAREGPAVLAPLLEDPDAGSGGRRRLGG